MIQLNLLPDVKLEYLKAQRSRRLMLGISVLVALASVGLLVLLLGVQGLQKKHLSDLNQDIQAQTKKLQNEPQINKMLTVQNQLGSLTDLHANMPAVSRLFEYLNEVTPAKVNITDFTVDFTQQNMTITGTADSLSSVNKYVDTLKFTTFTTQEDDTPQPAFNNIVLSNFSVNTSSHDSNQAANYTITLSYDKTIFDITQNVKLSVPNLVTTRSQADQAADLFKPAPAAKGGQ
jgi:Tfp pilus assembly protein PilN